MPRHGDAAINGLEALLASHGATLVAALEDAAADRVERAESYCYDCAEAPGELCETHANDLKRADEFRRTIDELRAVLDS